ncbi:MAG: MFS transporter [Vicinamibacterales bacterium]
MTTSAARSNAWALVGAAALGATLNPLNSTMVAVALPAIAREFSSEASSVTVLVVTSYLIATLVFQLPAGNIADRVGYTRALTWGRWLFFAGAVIGAFAPRLGAVVVGRLFMAAGGSLMVPTAMALVRVTLPAERRSRAFGTFGAILSMAAAIGPALGGWIAGQFGWRWLFAANVPVLLASWLLHLRGRSGAPTPSAVPHRGRPPFDWLGSGAVGAGLILVTLATRAQRPTSFVLMAAGAIVLAGLVAIERRARAPVLDLQLLGVPVFLASAGVIASQNLAMYSLLIQVPFMYGGPGFGLAVVALTLTMARCAPVGGWLAALRGARPLVVVGGALGAAGVLGLASLAEATPFRVAAWLLLAGLAIGLSTGPSQAAGLSAVPPEKSGVGSAALSTARYVGSIAGTVVLGLALVPGPDAGTRQHVALWVFAAAFVLSAMCGLALPRRPGGVRA